MGGERDSERERERERERESVINFSLHRFLQALLLATIG
jgi:hypothetical protein